MKQFSILFEVMAILESVKRFVIFLNYGIINFSAKLRITFETLDFK